jgi:hypothetical protein
MVLVPEKFLLSTEKGKGSRSRVLPLRVTFWAFVSQVMQPKSSCREVVRKVAAFGGDGCKRSGRARALWCGIPLTIGDLTPPLSFLTYPILSNPLLSIAYFMLLLV